MTVDEYPAIELRIRSFGKQLAGQILLDAREMHDGIERAFARLAESGELQKVVEAAAVRAVEEVVKDVMQSWDVREAMKKRVIAILEQPKRRR